MRRIILSIFALLPLLAVAHESVVSSPNGKLVVTINDEGGRATYSVALNGQTAKFVGTPPLSKGRCAAFCLAIAAAAALITLAAGVILK